MVLIHLQQRVEIILVVVDLGRADFFVIVPAHDIAAILTVAALGVPDAHGRANEVYAVILRGEERLLQLDGVGVQRAAQIGHKLVDIGLDVERQTAGQHVLQIFILGQHDIGQRAVGQHDGVLIGVVVGELNFRVELFGDALDQHILVQITLGDDGADGQHGRFVGQRHRQHAQAQRQHKQDCKQLLHLLVPPL